MGGATQGEKAALVKELREEGYTLKYLLAAMELSKSTYYYEIGKTDKVQERNADISSKIESIFQENKGRYGVRRVCQELVQRGFPVNHKRVQRIMNRLGLAGKRPKEKYHSYRGEVGKVAVNSSTGTLAQTGLCKSGQRMCPSLRSPGESAIFLQSLT